MSIAEFSVPRIRVLEPSRRLAQRAGANRWLVLATVAASLPVVVAFARAALHGWWPQGDDAVIGLKVWDVFHGHPPVMGMRSTSGAEDPSLSTHHPGPLEFYLLSVPAALTQYRPVGLLIGTALIGLATLVGLAIAGRRRGGLTLAVLLLAGAVCVQWAVGPETLFRPLNPYPAVLPVLLLLVLAWSLLADDLACMWGYALTASFVAQAHLAYVALVATLTALVAAVGLVRWRRRRDAMWPRPGWRPVSRSGPRHGRRALIVAVACWLPVLVETLRFDPNNFTLMARYATSAPQSAGVGLREAARLVTGLLAPVPRGFSSLPLDGGPGYGAPSTAAQVVGGLLVAVLILVAVRQARARVPSGARNRALGCTVAVIGLAASCASLAVVPAASSTPRYYVVGLWPAVGFAWAVLAWAAVQLVADRWLESSREAAVWRRVRSPLVSVSLLAAGAVVACYSPVSPDWRSLDRVQAASKAVAGRVEDIDDSARPVRIEAGGWVGWLTLSPAVAYRLRVEGHPVYVPQLWPYPQDDDFRRVAVAPADSIPVRIREWNGATWSGPDVGPDAQPAVTFPVGTDGRVEVYVGG